MSTWDHQPHPQGPSNNAGVAPTATSLPSLPSAAASCHLTPPGAIQRHPWCANNPEHHSSGLFVLVFSLLPAWFTPPPPPASRHPTPPGAVQRCPWCTNNPEL
ncbi:unnamed protein product [Cyclocybe aegerita]|uniref:Uncharacterized protein n=1 Tax=Cyclocybe aegerita TaxID=1973307 RepID=A0A8S0X167_CYCAE|nr:unnamed protein product [Cyclocybe aegerita]